MLHLVSPVRSSSLSACAGQCLDLTNGNLTNENVIQTWACTSGDTNQIWTLSSVRPEQPPPPTASHINPNGNGAKCLDVRGAVLENGTPVQMYVACG